MVSISRSIQFRIDFKALSLVLSDRSEHNYALIARAVSGLCAMHAVIRSHCEVRAPLTSMRPYKGAQPMLARMVHWTNEQYSLDLVAERSLMLDDSGGEQGPAGVVSGSPSNATHRDRKSGLSEEVILSRDKHSTHPCSLIRRSFDLSETFALYHQRFEIGRPKYLMRLAI